jgi:putative ABC transport system ATP-binding protein
VDSPPNARTVVLSVHGATKVYDMGEVQVHALRGTDLELYEGELVVLLGPSGSGKSTLLNLMGALDAPSEGEIRHRGVRLHADDDRTLTMFRRRHVGFVFQFYNLIPSLTARENVELVTEISEHPMSAVEALQLVGLGDRMDHFPSQLSGGQQQRVAIARAIAKRPEILLCDEPTGALDITTGKVVLQVLRRINDELGTTIAVITHNAEIGRMAHRVIMMADGRIGRIIVNEVRADPEQLAW